MFLPFFVYFEMAIMSFLVGGSFIMLKRLLNILLLRIRRRSAEWRALAFFTSVMIIFVTTYSLIVPAITLSTDSAEEMAGVYLEEEAMADEEYKSNDDGAYYEEPDEEIIAADDTAEETPDPDETGEEPEIIEPAATEEITSEDAFISTASEMSESSAENVSVTEEFLAPEELIEDGRYIIVRYGDDGNSYAMNKDGIAVPVVYDPDQNTAYCEDENQDIVWTKEGYAIRSDSDTYINLDEATEGTPAVSDEEAWLSAEKPDEGQFAAALYRTVVTDDVPKYYALVLSQDGTFFTTTIIDTRPVKRTILAKEAEREDDTEEEALSLAETVAEEETLSIAEIVAEEGTLSDAESAAEPVAEETAAMSAIESVAESVLIEYEAGSVTVPVEGADYTIQVSFGADACIPGDAVFKAISLDQKEEYAEYAEKAVEAAKAEQKEEDKEKSSEAIGVFDLTIYDAAGQVIQPAAPVSVSVNFGEALAAETEVCAVHFEGTGVQEEPEDDGIEYDEIEKTTDTPDPAVIEAMNEDGTVSFEADSFSVYVIVGTETIETTYLTASGETYKITVTYGPEAGIPKGARLQVEEILPDTDEYESYSNQAMDMLNAKNGEESDAVPEVIEGESYEAKIVSLPDESEIGFARFFDISIISNGEEIEPKEAVEVTIEYADPIELALNEEIQIVHFAEDGTEVIAPNVKGNEIIFEQESFSVTATITTNPSASARYALLALHEGTYYEVMFDGTLQEVTPLGNNSYTVAMPEAWQWYRQGGGYNYGLRVTRTSGVEYIDPTTYDGIGATFRTLARDAIGNGYLLHSGNTYLGITSDPASGGLVLNGGNNSTGAATFYFASLTRTTTGRTVDHIDIGVEAKASVAVPLAYGTYYYADGSVAEVVALGEFKEASGVNNAIPITEADLMSATISSYTESGGTRVEDNSFIINQYTSSTQAGEIDQVRIGGTFPIGWVTLSGNGSRGNIEQYITNQDQIHYEVAVTKPVELTLKKERGGTLTDLYQMDNDGNLVPLKVTVNVMLTSSFCYWDDDNECPGIQYTNSYSRNGTGQGATSSLSPAGMDFRLGTTDDSDASLAAIEIIKYTVNTDGQLISVASGGTFNFDIYQNVDGDVTAPVAWSGETTADVDYSGYSKVSTRSITAGSAGYGLSYDYSVDRGLVYIEETGDLEGSSITDTDGNTWDYVETYIQTEYAWRNDDGTTHSNVKQNNKMRAIPDVVGDYYSTAYDGALHNTFLEFYVYNVYKGGEVEFKKVDQSGYMIEGATFELYLSDPDVDASAIVAYRASSARNEETGLVEVDFGSVAYGTYYMMETDAPEGYVKDTNVYRVQVFEGESGNETCKIERKTDDGWVELSRQNDLYVFPNVPKYVNDFTITKVDENGSRVNGATLKFERQVATESGDQYVDYDFDPDTSGNQSTIAIGSQEISLGTGAYRISETGVPTGYESTFDYIYLTVNGENAIITLTDESGNAIAGVVDPDDSSKTTYTIKNDKDMAIIVMEEVTTTSEEDEGTLVTSRSYSLQVANKSTSRPVKIRKVDNSETPVPLKGARFTMVIDNVSYVFTSNDDGYLEFSGKIVDGREVPLEEGDPTGVLESLQTGDYVLVETDPPAGYIMLEGRKNIAVAATVTTDPGTVTAYDADGNVIEEGDTETEVAYYEISVVNESGSELPMTGGPGTFLYTLGGVMLIFASALIYAFRMRRRVKRVK